MGPAPRLALRLAYLGADFAGWQRQRGQRTVQGEVERGLSQLYQAPIALTGAGRTDAGVHADGQVAHFDQPHPIPPYGVGRALGGLLPDDVKVLRVWPVPAAFHACRSATGKRYRYRLTTGVATPWEALRRAQLPGTLDAELMRVCLDQALGEHDFAAFALAGHSGHGARGTRRRLAQARVTTRGRRFDIVLVGDGFLRGMARRLVGATVEVALGRQPVAWFGNLLSGHGARPPAPTAPAHGLTLERVLY
jgi:tRNA pseudouridine38-40 synthase